MLKKLILPILLAALLGPIISCNSSTSEDFEYTESSSVLVSAFSLSNDKKVLDSLSNVFFSIDLVNAKIFNADSLPYGTKISRLIPVITTPASAQEVKLTYYCKETSRDSVVNYLTNSTDSIDFSNGPVKLTVKSQSGAVVRNYEISINVHQVKADTLAWYSMASAPMPTTFGTLKGQCTAELKGTYYCLTTDGTSYCLATTENPYDPQWRTKEVALPFTAKVSSLSASESSLYMLSTDGTLYSSTDGETWSSTAQTWHHIYGGYEDEILGCANIGDDKYQICSYPSGRTWAMPSDFPIEGTSQTATYSVSMGYAPQLVMIGGRKANTTLTEYAWSFDGNEWAEISTLPIPTALEHITMVPYQLVGLSASNWAPRPYPVLLAFGGTNAQGSINRTVYYSRDWGMTWRKAPDTVQLPESLPAIYGSSAFVYTNTMYPSRATASWTELPLRSLPAQCRFMMPETPASRAIAPLTEWDCPAIYLFGGRYYNGQVSNTVWRGVILQYTFQPVQ